MASFGNPTHFAPFEYPYSITFTAGPTAGPVSVRVTLQQVGPDTTLEDMDQVLADLANYLQAWTGRQTGNDVSASKVDVSSYPLVLDDPGQPPS